MSSGRRILTLPVGRKRNVDCAPSVLVTPGSPHGKSNDLMAVSKDAVKIFTVGRIFSLQQRFRVELYRTKQIHTQFGLCFLEKAANVDLSKFVKLWSAQAWLRSHVIRRCTFESTGGISDAQK